MLALPRFLLALHLTGAVKEGGKEGRRADERAHDGDLAHPARSCPSNIIEVERTLYRQIHGHARTAHALAQRSSARRPPTFLAGVNVN